MPDVTPDELRAVYDCLKSYMVTAFGENWRDFAGMSEARLLPVAYSDSDLPEARDFVDWKNFATAPYVSATHGERFVVNHVNEVGAEAYARYEDIDRMPEGGVVAKPSFTIAPGGQAQLGPLFLMEKMAEGFSPETGDWKYTLVMADGSIGGVTRGQNAQAVQMCADCHMPFDETQDSLLFLPDEYRAR